MVCLFFLITSSSSCHPEYISTGTYLPTYLLSKVVDYYQLESSSYQVYSPDVCFHTKHEKTCLNNFSQIGLIITFLQFLFVTFFAYPSQFSSSSSSSSSSGAESSLLLQRPKVPMRRWAFIAFMFFGINMLNNWAFAYNISVPVHIILRSFGSVTTMIAGFVRGKRYSLLQVLSVVLLTVGVLISAWADSQRKVITTSTTTTSSSRRCLFCHANHTFFLFFAGQENVIRISYLIFRLHRRSRHPPSRAISFRIHGGIHRRHVCPIRSQLDGKPLLLSCSELAILPPSFRHPTQSIPPTSKHTLSRRAALRTPQLRATKPRNFHRRSHGSHPILCRSHPARHLLPRHQRFHAIDLHLRSQSPLIQVFCCHGDHRVEYPQIGLVHPQHVDFRPHSESPDDFWLHPRLW